MLEVYKLVARVAASTATVLVTGESGTGKELVARAIHTHSPRARAAFRAGELHALTESLLESELFGHARGAFTGAVGAKRGLFEMASGGTMFLDEIGDMGPKMQAQLLRTLQDGEVRRRRRRVDPRRRAAGVARRTRTWTRRSRRGASARTCTSASTSSPCAFRRCAIGATTCRRWSRTSWPRSRAASGASRRHCRPRRCAC